MEIVPRQNFRDARSVPAGVSRHDPRSDKFNEREVILNLKDCTSVQLPAVLWCVVYLLLAKQRGSQCVLIAPCDVQVASQLTDYGLFRLLKDQGVLVQRAHDIGPVTCPLLALTRFGTTTEAEDLTNLIHFALSESRQGSASVYEVLYETFSEIANNAAEHSSSPIQAYGIARYESSRFSCAVADGGVGIRTALLNNPLHQEYGHYEWSAMERATEELVSGTSDSYRGIGLFETVEKARIPGRELVIHSGTGIVSRGKKLTTRITSTRLFPGTMVYVSIPG